MSAPESFIELVRCQLVNIWRNAGRAETHLISGKRDEGMDFLATTREQIADLKRFVDGAAAHEVHTCSCGHTHYVHGDDA